MTITGTNLTAGSIVDVDGTQVTPTAINPDGDQSRRNRPHLHHARPRPRACRRRGDDPGRHPGAADLHLPGAPSALSLNPTEGPTAGGQTVTVTGTGFTSGSAVTIGGNTVTPTGVSSDGTSLTFVTPAHVVGPVDVTVTTAGGTTAPLTYTYAEPVAPPPTITDPTDGSTVSTTTPPISGTGTPGGTVTVIDGGTVICTATVASDGTWTCTPTTPLAPGTQTITAQQTVPAGTSAQSAPVTFTVGGPGGGPGDGSGLGTSSDPGLASTGTDTRDPALLGLLFVLLGGALLALARRRTHGRTHGRSHGHGLVIALVIASSSPGRNRAGPESPRRLGSSGRIEPMSEHRSRNERGAERIRR